MTRRTAGILLHPTSLPGPFGVGDLGRGVDRFLRWARDAGQSLWQLLPLVPPGSHGSPYDGLSAFAGNPLLISPELLVEGGLLDRADLDGAPHLPPDRVDFEAVAAWKDAVLRRSHERFERRAPAELRERFAGFSSAPAQRPWLDHWALFMALRRRHPRGWWEWPRPLARRHPEALEQARREEAAEIDYQRYLQFLFFTQWQRVREVAHRLGVRIFGDVPIYVARDSAEVWARPELFELDDELRPEAVAGVPPDYFSDTGQLWGNPLYRWDRLAEDGYKWWIARLAANLRLTDLVRLDHFRGFAGYWRVPVPAETAEGGEWRPGPGAELFDACRRALGELPLVAEDLGVITPEVTELRHRLGLPGMKVLQFAFDDPDSEHLPHRLERRSYLYTGTHDNDTAAGWYGKLGDDSRRRFHRYAGAGGEEPHWTLVRLAYTSVAEGAVVPVQDLLGLGSEARMNTPARAAGNWRWRLEEGALDDRLAGRLRELAEVSGRLPAAGGGRGGDGDVE